MMQKQKDLLHSVKKVGNQNVLHRHSNLSCGPSTAQQLL